MFPLKLIIKLKIKIQHFYLIIKILRILKIFNNKKSKQSPKAKHCYWSFKSTLSTSVSNFRCNKVFDRQFIQIS